MDEPLVKKKEVAGLAIGLGCFLIIKLAFWLALIGGGLLLAKAIL